MTLSNEQPYKVICAFLDSHNADFTSLQRTTLEDPDDNIHTDMHVKDRTNQGCNHKASM